MSLRLLGDDMGQNDKGVVLTMKNNGDGTDFSSVVESITDVNLYGGVEPGALIDMDGDQTLDLLGTATFQPALQPFLNDGSGGFSMTSPALSREEFQGCIAVDFVKIPSVNGHNSGIAVLAASCNGDSPSMFPIQLVRPTGQGSVTYTAGPASSEDPRGLAAGDVDGDTLADLLVWSQAEKAFSLYSGNDSGNFQFTQSFSEADTCPACPCLMCMGTTDYVRMFASNLDGDARADLVATGDSARVGMLLAADQTWSWLERKPLIAGDFNEDGLTDFLARNGVMLEVLLSNP